MRSDPVLVIGAGHNGLVCATMLAEAGVDVVVLEQAAEPGGGVRTIREGGFSHDPCAGFFPLTRASPAFAALGLEVDWVVPGCAMAHPFADGSSIVLHRDLEVTVASLEAARRGSGRAWRELIGPLLRFPTLVFETALSSLPPPPAKAAALAARIGGDALELGRLMAGSSAALGCDALGGPEPAAWLTGSAVHSDLAPTSAGSAAFALFLKLLGHTVGWPLPRGGADAITRALVARIEAAGGRVECGARVDRIALCAGRVTGVRAGGSERPAGAAVAALSVAPLLRLLPEQALPERLLRRLRRWRYGIGTFKVDFELAAPVPWTSEPAREAGVVHVGPTLEDQKRAAFQASCGLIPERPTLVAGQHSVHDSSRAPAGRHTLYAYTHVPAGTGSEREAEVADRVEQRIEELAPGFRRLVERRLVRSPAEIEEENPSLVGGDLGGGSFEVDQQAVFRPAPGLLRGRTPVAGLYVAGPSVHPGAGVHGVSGARAARSLLSDRSATGRARRAVLGALPRV